MKAKIFLIFSLLIPFALILIYVWITASDLVFRDDMYLIKGGFVESYCKGTLTFADLWRPAAATRILGYNLLQVANIKWFGMNAKLMALSIPFLMLCSAIFIYRGYRKSLAQEHSPEFIAATYFVLAMILFNVVQWEGLTFGYGFVFQSPMPFFIATIVSIEAFLMTGARKFWPAAFILLALAVLVFGGSHIFTFVPALITTFLCYVITRQNKLPSGFWIRALLIGVCLAIMMFLYLHRIHKNEYFPGYSLHVKIDAVLAKPLQALQFLLAAFAASVVGVDAANAYLSFHTMVVIGLVVGLFYTLALGLFFQSRMYERTYLTFFLIVQTIYYLGFMTIGRFAYGINYGMASRYTCVSIYGLVALAWIFIFTLTRSVRTTALLKAVFYSGFAMIFVGLLLTAVVEWRIQPFRKIYFKQLHAIALRVDTATPEELSKFEERPKLVRDSLRLLREYRLNVYRTLPGGQGITPLHAHRTSLMSKTIASKE